VPGWDPAFPVPERTEGPGAVFVTAHGDERTTWVVVDQDERGVRYARVTPGAAAGTVAVMVLEAGEDSTRLRVTYDLTALTPDHEPQLEAFAAGFPGHIAQWEAAIAASLSAGD
jgi:hypothetical protein